jgi:ribosomal protein S18 acetylase RimI-like enzyme
MTLRRFVEVERLFREYAASLEFALDFQHFEDEVSALPGAYAPPGGALLVVRCDGAPVGCVGLRPLDTGTGEIMRLYVRDRFRGLGLGRRLADAVIAAAAARGYERLRLDTVPSMGAAQVLYRSLGFREIEPYTTNPVEGARFFELDLGGRRSRPPLRPGWSGSRCRSGSP